MRAPVGFWSAWFAVPGRPLNVAATIAWDGALRRGMGFGLIRRDGTRADQLAGAVVVVLRSS